MSKKMNTVFYDQHGYLRAWAFVSLMVLGIVGLVVVIVGLTSWITWRDCPTLCTANDAEPVWTLSEGCSCAKDGELVDPTAKPAEIRLR